MEQRTSEWFTARAGFVSASRMAGVMVKKADAKTRDTLMAELIAERLTGHPVESFDSFAMRRGTDMEPIARSWYESQRDIMVHEVGFIKHPTIPYFGASPDGLVGDDGLIEIKCPNTTTHINTLLRGSYDETYKLQIQTQLACTGRQWCDFVTYDDRLTSNLCGGIFRVHRDHSLIHEIECAVVAFNLELDLRIAQLERLYF